MTKTNSKDYSGIPFQTDERLAAELPKLVNCAKGQGIQSASAHDIAQSAGRRIWKTSKGKWTLPYLWEIFRNIIKDRSRKAKRLPKQLDDEILLIDDREDLSILDKIIEKEAIEKLLPMLTDRDADVLDLRRRGYKRAEIMDELGITSGEYGHSSRRIKQKIEKISAIIGIDSSSPNIEADNHE